MTWSVARVVRLLSFSFDSFRFVFTESCRVCVVSVAACHVGDFRAGSPDMREFRIHSVEVAMRIQIRISRTLLWK